MACLLFVGLNAHATPPAAPSVAGPFGSNGTQISIEDVAKFLQETRNPPINDQQELAFLEQQMNQMEAGLLGGFKNAADSRQPVQDLEHQVAQLKTIAALLKGLEKCAFTKSLDALREQLDRKQAVFKEKTKSSAAGKGAYLTMLKEVSAMQGKLTAVTKRLQMLQADSDRLAGKATEWISIYRDSVSFLGEAEARKTLNELLHEDPLTAKQFDTPKPAAPTAETTSPSPNPVDQADGSRRASENPRTAQADQPAEARPLPAVTPPPQHTETRDSAAEAQEPKTGAWYGAAANAPMPGEHFPETRLLQIETGYATSLSAGELRYAINEMFARHGAVFPQKEISVAFQTKKWYRPRIDLSFDQIEKDEFSEIERFNLKVLGDARDFKSTGTRNPDTGAQAPKAGTWNGAAANAPMPGEHFPETRLRHLDQADTEYKSIDMLRYAINEMFARHGAVFPQKEISVVFQTKNWYRPCPGLSFDQIEEREFSEIERFNLKILGDARDLKSTGKSAVAPEPWNAPPPQAKLSVRPFFAPGNLNSALYQTNSVRDMRMPIDAIYAAWERLDINAYIAQWAADGVKIDPNTNGKTRIQVLKVERARLFEKLASVETQHESIFRNIENGIATFDVTYKMRFTFKSGKTFSENAKESYRLQKYSNRWLIVENKDYGS